SFKYPFVSYVKNGQRSGKGGAIKRVIQRATGELIILMDADGSVKFRDVVESMSYVNGYDVIMFNRYSGVDNKIPLIRRVPSRGYNILVRVFFGIGLRDTQCGYIVGKAEMLKEVFKRISITNGFYYVPMIYYIKNMGGTIKELKVKYEYDSNSKFRLPNMILGGAISLLAFRLRHSRFYKYIPEWAANLYMRKFRWI
ncbi:MAG: glycosyltransferase, partial [Candidatus Parvarchaeota archaeon]